MNQLDIFSLLPSNPSGELPKAIVPVDPKTEAALQQFGELKKFEIKQQFVPGCTVRSSSAFKGKTAKFLRTEQISTVKFAVVELEFRGCLIEYSCNLATLEVVE